MKLRLTLNFKIMCLILLLVFVNSGSVLADAWLPQKPIDQAGWLAEAKRCLKDGDDLAAVLAYTNAIECAAATPELYYQRAKLYYRLGYCELAQKDAGRAIALKAQYGEAYYLRAQIEENPVSQPALRDEAKALADYGKSVELLPELGQAYYARARLLARQGADAEARVNYEKVLALGTYGYQHGAHVGLGIIYGRGGLYAKALQELKQADLAMNPWETLFALAQAYELSED